MKLSFLSVASLLFGALSRAAPVLEDRNAALAYIPEEPELVPRTLPELPRLVIYFQTTHDASTGQPISMLPLITEKNIALTHLIVCTFHINLGGVVHLNDFPPNDPRFYTLWNETRIMKDAGVKVMGMVGGAAPGSFDTTTLDAAAGSADFELYYGQLRDTIHTFGLQGMDLDVEQRMSQRGITRLVQRLRADFGPDFIITLAPVGSALMQGSNISGFDYSALEDSSGDDIRFYNAQFYNGFGSMATPRDYETVIDKHGWDPKKILAGQVTNPANGGSWVPFDQLNATIKSLRSKYGEIGGIMGWEYFNSEPGGTEEPWRWARNMTSILRPNDVPRLAITAATAARLTRAWKDSLLAKYGGALGSIVDKILPDVDYLSMVNA
ncbi:GH18 endo-N-acetyl-beta-D-glucosaminidase endo T [Diplogelasinospora grovesii]|uniref:GH18 endo-N-acetyl-beta-D-glucosaminidase endo T n=1 Tax=Diplogelasinospora grovesii TaxID=303347 RepID=A0AAN6N277_9PEZI|nr:GH18 endo-N-acetyl-beta-D-glucosaminidase endo T [Diplogelasinospora grovesii]